VSGRARLLSAGLSGSLLVFAFPGTGGQGWLAFAALVPLLVAVAGLVVWPETAVPFLLREDPRRGVSWKRWLARPARISSSGLRTGTPGGPGTARFSSARTA